MLLDPGQVIFDPHIKPLRSGLVEVKKSPGLLAAAQWPAPDPVLVNPTFERVEWARWMKAGRQWMNIGKSRAFSGLTNQISYRKWSSFVFPHPQWSSTVTLEDFSGHQKKLDPVFSPRKCLFHRSWSPVQARSVTKLKSDFTINSIVFSFVLTDMCAGFQFFKGYFSLWKVISLPSPEKVKNSGVCFLAILRPAHSWEA